MKKLKSFITAILIIACMACLSVGLVACGSSDDNGSNGGSQPTMTVGLNKLDATLILGSKTESGLTLIATVTQASGEEYAGEYIWKCEGTAVTILDNKETCVVQAAEVGTASVTVTVGNFSVTCNITVIENSVTKLTVDKNTMSLAVDGEDTVNVTATLADGTAYIDFEWELSGETVASVTKTGSVLTVTGLGEGSTTLTVSAGNLTAKCEIIVGGGSETHEHTFPAPGSDDLVIEWKWNERDETSSTVEVVITCSGCNEEVGYTVEYTSDDGGKTLTASLTVGSNTYTSTYDMETGGSEEGGHAHSYTASWEWNDDYTCTVTLTCSDEDGECTEKTMTGAAAVEKTETPATCTEDGSVVYTASFEHDGKTYVCDETKTQTIPAAGHTPAKVDAVEATCEAAGSIEYWECSVCGKIFSEEACENELTADDIVVPAGHKLEHVEAQAATCTTEGNIEYWVCSVCNAMFADSSATQELTAEEVFSDKTDHIPGSTYSYDNGYHYTTCTLCGEAVTKETHAFGENYSCTVCGYDTILTDGTYGLTFALVSGNDQQYEVTGLEDGIEVSLLVIPSTYNGLPVVGIALKAFEPTDIDTGENRSWLLSITEVVLQSNLVEIGGYAFDGLTALEKITMADVVTIGNYAFRNCTSLTDVSMPKVTTLGSNVFSACTALVEIAMPSVVTVGTSAFSGCTSLTRIDFGTSIATLSTRALEGCTSLTELGFPASLRTVGQRAFTGCTNLKTVIFSAGLTSVDLRAFENCSGLETVYIPSTVTFVGEKAFSGAGGNIYVENTAEYVTANWQQKNSDDDAWDNGFTGRTYYYSKDTPELNAAGTAYDGNYWHYVEGVITIWEYTKDGDAGADVGNDIFTYAEVSGGYQVTGIAGGYESVANIEIPAYHNDLPVVSIAQNAFQNETSLVEVVVGENVTEIGMNAFYGCSNLTTVILPEGLTTIGNNAFKGCRNLNIVIPLSVTYVGESAFYNVYGTIYINTKEYVGSNWHDEWNEDFEGTIYYYSETAPELDAAGDAYNGKYWHYVNGEVVIWEYTSEEDTIFVFELINDGTEYQVNGLKDDVNEKALVIPDYYNGLPVTKIANSAFYNNDDIVSVVVGANVTEIGSQAFYSCESLTTVVLPIGLTTIDYQAFKSCDAIVELIVPLTVTYVGDGAFANVEATLYINTKEYVSENWDDDWDDDFEGKSKLHYYSEYEPELNASGEKYNGNYWHYVDGEVVIWVYVPEESDFEFTLINDGTSYQLDGIKEGVTLTAVVIPDTYKGLPVTKIADNAFKNDSDIISVVVGANVTEIGQMAFYGCDSMTTISLPDGLATIGKQAFKNCESLQELVIPLSVTYVGETAFCEVTCILYINTKEFVDDHWDDDWDDEYTMKNTIHYYSEFEPSLNAAGDAYDGNYWHYVDGVVAVWVYTPSDDSTDGGYEETDGLAYTLMSDGLGYQVTGIGNAGGVTDLVIPANYDGLPVVSIAKNAFKDNTTIATVVVGENVTEILDSAFYGCSSLTTVILPAGLASIGFDTFCGCSSLTDLIVPVGVTFVGDSAFAGMKGPIYIEAASKGSGWDDDWNDDYTGTIYYYREDDPGSGNYWHYADDGVTPVKWY